MSFYENTHDPQVVNNNNVDTIDFEVENLREGMMTMKMIMLLKKGQFHEQIQEHMKP